MYTLKFENLTIKSDFMFKKVFGSHPELCREMIQRILHLNLGDFSTDTEKEKQFSFDSKNIRLDVYVEDEKRWVSVEMQVANIKREILYKRARYYSSVNDASIMESAEGYESMKDGCVIFLCDYDPFDQGRVLYTFRKYCAEDRDILCEDGSTIVYVNLHGDTSTIEPKLKNFIEYARSSYVDKNDSFIRELDAAVSEGRKNRYWKEEFMMESPVITDAKIIGREEGRKEGSAIGKAEIIVNMVTNAKFSLDQAVNLAGISGSEKDAVVGLVKKMLEEKKSSDKVC